MSFMHAVNVQDNFSILLRQEHWPSYNNSENKNIPSIIIVRIPNMILIIWYSYWCWHWHQVSGWFMISKDVYHFLRIKDIFFGRYNIKKDRVQVRTTPSFSLSLYLFLACLLPSAFLFHDSILFSLRDFGISIFNFILFSCFVLFI